MSWLSNLAHEIGSALRPLEKPVGTAVIAIAEPEIIASVESDLHKELTTLGLQATEKELDAIFERAVDKAFHGGA